MQSGIILMLHEGMRQNECVYDDTNFKSIAMFYYAPQNT